MRQNKWASLGLYFYEVTNAIVGIPPLGPPLILITPKGPTSKYYEYMIFRVRFVTC